MPDPVKLDGCVNCHVCEMACSLHHTGRFSLQYSSIAMRPAQNGVYIMFKNPFTCDTCEGEGGNQFQCVKYCFRAKDALRNFILTQGNAEAKL